MPVIVQFHSRWWQIVAGVLAVTMTAVVAAVTAAPVTASPTTSPSSCPSPARRLSLRAEAAQVVMASVDFDQTQVASRMVRTLGVGGVAFFGTPDASVGARVWQGCVRRRPAVWRPSPRWTRKAAACNAWLRCSAGSRRLDKWPQP